MIPAFWLTIQAEKVWIPLPFLILLPFALALEMLAFLPLIVYSICKKNIFLLKISTGFYLSRIILAFIIYGRKFKVRVNENGKKVHIAGRIISKDS